MHSKISSDWPPSYTKVTRLVVEIFKMAGYFPDMPRTVCFFVLNRLIIIIIIIIIIITLINCNWVVTRWQWLFYMYTKHEIGY